jgi:hypothetical protein
VTAQRGLDAVSLLARLAHRLVLRLPIGGVSISVINSAGHDGTIYATDAIAARLDELHFELGEGPSFTVWEEGTPELLADLDEPGTDATRWPVFVREALATGARGLWAFPLQLGAARVGILTLYSLVPIHLTQSDFGHALRASDGAALAILGCFDGDGATSDSILDHDDRDEFYRAEVYQASGIVMAQLDTDIGGAFARMRAYAFGNNLRISDVAADIVGHTLRLSDSFD